MSAVREAVPASQGWPAEGLEHLGCCPLCGASARSTVHAGLEDTLFEAAPGSWTLWRCGGCGLGYLDPRPDPQTIGRAYGSYYTHAERPDDDPLAPGATLLGRLKQRVLRQHVAREHGPRGPAWRTPLAPLVALRPGFAQAVRVAMRGLPRPGPGATLLDIGCGSGRFMAWARAAGWQCLGTEVDPVAAARARARGFEVELRDPAELAARGQRFAAVTISHVLEHVHHPRALLQSARALLAPGGYFWIDTPNLQAHGHARFGRHWRGLEPPRHLQIFHPGLLRQLLAECGFEQIRAAPWQGEWDEVARASIALAARAGVRLDAPTAADAAAGRVDDSRREFITLVATAGPHA